MGTNKIRIVLADDHQMVRMGLSMMINTIDGFECVGQVDDGESAVAAYIQLVPDLILLDIFMPHKNGLTAAKEILRHNPNAKILMMTAFIDNNMSLQALEIGAMGVFEKNISPEDFEMAVKIALKGKIWYNRSTIQGLIAKAKLFDSDTSQFNFTDRETKISRLLMQGKTNLQIAHELGMSVNTVKKDLSYLYSKLKVSSRAEATTLLTKTGLGGSND